MLTRGESFDIASRGIDSRLVMIASFNAEPHAQPRCEGSLVANDAIADLDVSTFFFRFATTSPTDTSASD